MVYLALPRHREGLELARDSGRSQREILDQILGPKKQEVIQLYFTHIHPAFPVLDEELISGVAAREKGPDAHDVRRYHFTTLRRAATHIADFVCSLKGSHLGGFWLSFTGHLLVSAATVLLRCAIDTTNATVAEECRSSLRTLRSRLHLAKIEDNWDLADMFIKRCDEPISRITALSDSTTRDQEVGTVPETQAAEESQQLGTQQEPLEFGIRDYPDLNSFGPLDYPWESLWDMLES
ncbi:hypothetical protein SLS58_002451 [Diplodia intermedia]|uniref:C6 transcription factor n=1 Tax=Diplodia intermedia TaxID=856260 RepID=A0ABR3TZI8_9PEZI